MSYNFLMTVAITCGAAGGGYAYKSQYLEASLFFVASLVFALLARRKRKQQKKD